MKSQTHQPRCGNPRWDRAHTCSSGHLPLWLPSQFSSSISRNVDALLYREENRFARSTARATVAPNRPVRADNPVTRDRDRKGVGPTSIRNCSVRTRISNSLCYAFVSPGFTRWYLSDLVPNPPLEGRPLDIWSYFFSHPSPSRSSIPTIS